MAHHDGDLRRCMENCHRCHDLCVQTAQYCLAQGGRYAESSHVRLLLDCAQICQTSEDFMLRGSDLHPLTCGVCSQVCERCGEGCEKLGEDALIKQCAEACWTCASSCAHMAGIKAPAGASA